MASFVSGSFWLFFPQLSFVFNNFLASFLKKRIVFYFFGSFEGSELLVVLCFEKDRHDFSPF